MKFSKIKDNDIANGIGITMSLWTQGCPHHCKGCFNSETWDFKGGKEFTNNDLQYIFDNIDKNNIQRNLSVLGGEPLCSQNIDGVIDLCKEFKKNYPEKIIYLWTGYVFEQFNELQVEVLKYIDVLIDGKFEEEKRNLSIMLRGSSNQRIIDVKNSLINNNVIIYKL
ncbi:anaerobic ribonucleoside-triphosphate reductase activating protein [Romboutsia maritimum]|uniref:Anaerobic ribonucleoside-triphosphate reductase-activating protein n=1 Tax=Romboutsia maritimum TaxID=2020948 RepID=A0A371IS71_9FIRM|nr:anaerobic ribonucleoside-triphosphate reductase activating protein [Romboutsia maritimum]RDY23332.1 anaerobic ribonucleoside-triphosphate reductase activating protein [Romboutsia maritimum]